uniref:Uncharacterized protein n=1 Tax=viral metagenome TaxID=1070528 RepID=A0A6C0KDD5_9ZZZZ
MPTVKDLRRRADALGLTGFWKLRKHDLQLLIACVVLQRWHRRGLKHECPISGERVLQPVWLRGHAYELTSLRSYLADHAVELSDPMTGCALSDAELSAVCDQCGIQQSARAVRSAAERRRQQRELAEISALALDDLMHEIDTDEATGVRGLEWATALIADARSHLHLLARSCPASADAKFAQLHNVTQRQAPRLSDDDDAMSVLAALTQGSREDF